MRLIRSCGVLSLSFAALGAAAQNLQPGLWEFTTQMSGESGSKMNAAMENMQKQMAAMSPEQRKMMQDMMAKQGVQMGSAAGSGITVKMCLTQELLDRNEMVSGQRGECKNTWSPRTGNTMKYAFSCSNPPSSGEGEVTFISREAYSNRTSMTTTANGKTEKMNINGSGKWLTKDCGAVKPLVVPAGK
jgi:hypothetical protein